MYLNKRNLEERLTEIMNDIIDNEMEMATKEDLDIHIMLVDKETKQMYSYPTDIVCYDINDCGVRLDINKSIESYLYYNDLLNYKSCIDNIGCKRILHEVEHDSIKIDGSLHDKIVVTILHKILPDYAVLKVVNSIRANDFKVELEKYISENYMKDFEKAYRELHTLSTAV